MFTYRVVDSPKREDEAMNAGRQYLFSTNVMVYFMRRQGQGTDSLAPPEVQLMVHWCSVLAFFHRGAGGNP